MLTVSLSESCNLFALLLLYRLAAATHLFSVHTRIYAHAMQSNTEPRTQQRDDDAAIDLTLTQAVLPVCPACGARARRAAASFCHTCGRAFALDAGYMPADALRASYHLQREIARPSLRVRHKSDAYARESVMRHGRAKLPFAPAYNSAAALALAAIVYALIPFLGIIFCPGAIVCGGLGAVRARRLFAMDGWRASLFSICAAVLIFCAQVWLWMMLRNIPHWTP